MLNLEQLLLTLYQGQFFLYHVQLIMDATYKNSKRILDPTRKYKIIQVSKYSSIQVVKYSSIHFLLTM